MKNTFGSALNRRDFTAAALSATAAMAFGPSLAAAAEPAKKQKYCAFIKFLTELKYEELADKIAELGFDGVEVTIREQEGYIHPAKAAEELPKFKAALEKRGLEITIATTDILAVDQPHALDVLRACTDVGVPRYRLGFFRYDLKKSIVEQIAAIRFQFEELAETNRDLGITGMYQNHAGVDFYGATMWDLFYVLREFSPKELSCVYDLRHAAVEAGESWPLLYQVMKPYITAYSVKDFVFKDRKSQHVPLGEGMVDPQFYKDLAKSDFDGPISVHVEYLKTGKAPEQLAALERDFETLKKWMAS